MADYDSSADTLQHKLQVQRFITLFMVEMLQRAVRHDDSKLASPEKELFDEWTPKLAAVTYNSPEYKDMLAKLAPALEHHYARNSHHPQHYPNSVRGMNLLDLIEMFCDWKAATLRHNDGNLQQSIIQNQVRFNFSDDLKQIMLNTLSLFENQGAL